jgi:spore coat polysaccharide biosynthesis protein SpsF
MKIAAIIQARMTSKRLPGKVLQPIAGKPLIQYLIERLQHCKKRPGIVIATSTDSSDNVIEDFAGTQNIPCYRGPLQNVASRFRGACEANSLDAFVRVNADSPLIDPALIDRALTLFEQTGSEIVTNVQERTFPKGQSVEFVQLLALQRALPRMTSPDDFEHVTRFFYEHPQDFRIHNFAAHGNFSDVRLVVDTIADFSAIEGVIQQMTKPHWEYGWTECLELYKESASWLRTPLG